MAEKREGLYTRPSPTCWLIRILGFAFVVRVVPLC